MKSARPWTSVAVAVALLIPSVAHADWMSLHFGIDGPDALQRVAAVSGVTPYQGPPIGGELYGSLDPSTYQNFEARYESRFFVSKVNFIFSEAKLYAIELSPVNLSANAVLVYLSYEYGAPELTQDIDANNKEYLWRDIVSKNFIVLATKSSGEATVIYRPLLSPHSTGF